MHQPLKRNKELSPEQREKLLKVLKARFEKNIDRHKGLEWDQVADTVISSAHLSEQLSN
jgi:hypothetical protein